MSVFENLVDIFDDFILKSNGNYKSSHSENKITVTFGGHDIRSEKILFARLDKHNKQNGFLSDDTESKKADLFVYANANFIQGKEERTFIIELKGNVNPKEAVKQIVVSINHSKMKQVKHIVKYVRKKIALVCSSESSPSGPKNRKLKEKFKKQTQNWGELRFGRKITNLREFKV